MDFTRKNSAASTQCSSCGGATWGSSSQRSGSASSRNPRQPAGAHRSSSCVCSLYQRSGAGAGSPSNGGPPSVSSTRVDHGGDTGSVWGSSGGGGGGELGSNAGGSYVGNTSPPPSVDDGQHYQLHGSHEAYQQYPSGYYWCPRSSAGAQTAPVSPQLERFQFSTSRDDNPNVWIGSGGGFACAEQDLPQQTPDNGGGGNDLATADVAAHFEEINQRLPQS